jgi:D-sedoheptulose 7-phosphate isomerase
MKLDKDLEQYIIDSADAILYLKNEIPNLLRMADTIANAYKNNKKVVLFGNGGSAADAQHIAGELMGKFYLDRAPLKAIALTVNSSVLTAIGNDFGYEAIFARQVNGFVESGDVVIGLSTSGESLNVLKGIEAAKANGAVTIAFQGKQGKLASMTDFSLCIPSIETPHIQEAHITAGHIICCAVEHMLFGDNE